MRFQRLNIPAYGPFTNLDLSFSAGAHDLHVIYGPNEAGKSSLLRAIRDLLFGIHGQSPDNFLHDYKKMLLSGEIENVSGEQLVFQRRKGNKNTLLDKEGNMLPDTALFPFLGSVQAPYFSTMFGLGQKELHDGAAELLRGEGEVGTALFSASMGGTPIQRVLDSLIEESEKLYKGRTVNQVSIRPAVKRYKDLLKQSRDSMVNPEAWDRLEKDLAEQEVLRLRLNDELVEKDQQWSWISRCEDALVSVGRWIGETQLLEALPPLPDLASDFVARAQSARKTSIEAAGKVQTLTTQITQLEHQLAACRTSPAVLAEAEALDALHQELGAYRDRRQQLTNLEIKLAGLEPVLRAGMEHLGVTDEFDSLEAMRLSSAMGLGCVETAKALGEALHKRDDNHAKAEELKQKIESFDHDLKSRLETDLTPLRDALVVAAEATEANKTLPVSESNVVDLTRDMMDQLGSLIGAPEDSDAAASLAVPALSTIRKFRDQFNQLHRDIKKEEDIIGDSGKSLDVLQGELTRMDRRGSLPSEDALDHARSLRDRGWQLVLSDWKGDGGGETFVPGTPLEEAFPESITEADHIADQLRQHAEAVAQAEEKRVQITKNQKRISEARSTLIELQESLGKCQDTWASEWTACGLKARSPDEMEEWREGWLRFRDTLRRLRSAETTRATKRDQIQRARESLAAVLAEENEKGFAVLFDAAKRKVQKGERLTGQRDEMSKQLQTHLSQLEVFDQKSAALVKNVDAAQARWKSQCQAAGLPVEVSPESGLKLLEERRQLLMRFDAWKEVSGESRKAKETMTDYEQTVHEKAVTLNLQGDTAEAQEAGLWQALTQARKVQVQHDQLTEQIQIVRNNLRAAEQAETQASQALESLMALAELSSPEALEPLLANLEKRDATRHRIEDLKAFLGGLARGQTVEAFVVRVQAENADELPQQKVRLEGEQTETKTQLHSVQGRIAELQQEKQKLESAGDAAAGFRQQAESEAAAIRQDAARFLRLRLAVHSLRTQIERFRKENQGPLLEKSGEVFKDITRGAFDSLGAEFNEQDVPVLVGRRQDGTSVKVEGMSEGSRDQLYLALRLAALEGYLNDHEPMPLILDDLLITFDDERAGAMLPRLADLAKRTQIFLFTHHDHLVELCRKTLGKDQFHLHQLTPRG